MTADDVAAGPVTDTGESRHVYQSKPSLIEAVQWNDETAVDDLWAHTDGKVNVRFDPDGTRRLDLLAGKDGAQDWVPVPLGHWIVHPPGDTSDVWPVEDAYFQDKYVAVHSCGEAR